MNKNLKKILAVFLTLGIMLTSGSISKTSSVKASEGNDKTYYYASVPNEDAIAKLLMKKGVIGKNSTSDEVKKAVNNYIRQKLVPMSDIDKQQVKKNILKNAKENGYQNLNLSNLINNRKNGIDPLESNIESVSEKKYKGEVRTGKLLVLLTDFSNDSYGEGPLKNQIEKPLAANNSSLWISDFSKDHYNKMLFSPGGYDAVDQNGKNLHINSMVDYYLQQSCGSYKVTGGVYGWYTLPHSEAYYGDDAASGNDNLLPGTPSDLVKDLLNIAQKDGVPFADYDYEDPYDLDDDGNIDEPDGIIDHLVIVHAGIDQSAGGGAQGDDAIWAHSSSIQYPIPGATSNSTNFDGQMMAYNYIIQGEDCAIGTFTHEFAHDLGLPDEYDTQYTAGGEPVEFWSLMSSGSWLGKPLDIEPSSISPWGRMVLGQIWGGNWAKPVNVDLASLTSKGTTYNIDQAVSYGSNNQAIKVNLPDQKKILAAQPVSGGYYCYSGKGDDMDNTMTISAALPSVSDLKLNFKLWFNTESLWDFGFVRVSADNGTTWTSLSSAMTTSNHDPEADASIVANLPGYTGNSNGWVNESLDLSSYAGKNILLRFEYMTDAAMSYDGLFIDDISIMAGTSTVLSEGFENGIGSFNNNGWALSSGEEYKGHYYMLEWRNFTKTDETLKNCYNFTDYNKGIAEYYSYEPGLVLWYRNMMYDDNWVGLHPGYAFLGVVDSHPNPLMFSASTALRPRLQLSDAVFNIKAVPSKYVTIKGKKVQIGNKPAAPVFDDSNTYYYPQAYDSGLKLVNYGFKFQVTGASTDGTVGSVTLYKKQ